MISFKKARQIVLKDIPLQKKERIYFLDALGRVLARGIKAGIDLPLFNRSSVDGFALKSAEVKGAKPHRGIRFKIIDTIPAGRLSRKHVGRRQAVKIMTGAAVPKGADCVVMQENAVVKGDSVFIFKEARLGEHIFYRGEDIKRGETAIKKGSVINPAVVGLLATFGQTYVYVYKKPEVAILVTGDELRDLNRKLTPGKIRSSNQYALFGQVKEAGGIPKILGIARDNLKDLEKKIARGLRSDVLLISGGVSVGDWDLVPRVLRRLGVKIYFEKVAVQPGKPVVFGKSQGAYVFGLPGNPVSTMISFYAFVRPFLRKMCGCERCRLNTGEAALGENIALKPERAKILRGITANNGKKISVRLASHQGSGNLLSVARANCLMFVHEGVTNLKKGKKITIHYLPS